MKKIFISMPMNDKSDKQIKLEFEQAKRKIIDKYGNVEFVDSYLGDTELEDPIEMLGKSISLMAEADAIYFCKGWEEARGCRIEREVAYQYVRNCIYEELE